MADKRLRELERRWRESGRAEDEAAYLRERVRAGAGSGARSQDDEALGRELAALVEGSQVPGMALALVRPAGAVAFATSGPVTPETLFPLCSTSKVVTALALLELDDREVLPRHRPVCELVPWLTPPALDEESRAGLTLSALLAHTGGISDEAAPPRAMDLVAYGRDFLPRLSAIASPGEVFWYSNAGFNLAGLVAQEATGTSFDRLVRELVLDPLGMERSTFEPSPTAARARPAFGEGLGPEEPCGWPSGGLHANIRDLARMGAALLQPRRGAPLSEWVIERQALVRADAVTAGVRHYGQGLGLGCQRSLEVRTHGGGAGAYGSAFALVPALGLGVVALFAHPAGHAVAAEALSRAIGEASGTHSLRGEYELAAPRDGVFWSADRQRLELSFQGEQVLARRGGQEVVLGRASRQLFRGEGLTVGLVPWLPGGHGPRFVMLDAHGLGFVSAVPYRREGDGWPPPRSKSSARWPAVRR